MVPTTVGNRIVEMIFNYNIKSIIRFQSYNKWEVLNNSWNQQTTHNWVIIIIKYIIDIKFFFIICKKMYVYVREREK